MKWWFEVGLGKKPIFSMPDMVHCKSCTGDDLRRLGYTITAQCPGCNSWWTSTPTGFMCKSCLKK